MPATLPFSRQPRTVRSPTARSGSTPSDTVSLASGRFFATPGRRGKPGGVGPVLRRTRKPVGAASRLGGQLRGHGGHGPGVGARADPEDDRAALGDERQAPLRSDRRRRERLREAPPCNVCITWLSARPQITLRFGSSAVQPSRNSALRRSASSSVTSRSGSDAASGIPGVPPPEPTSTIGPSKRRTRSSPASASSSSTRRASPRSFSAVSPGVAITASSQRSSNRQFRVAARAGQTSIARGRITT